jgi:CHAD domain-containing protein
VSHPNPRIAESFCRLGASYIRRQAAVLARQAIWAGKLDSDCIHQGRVTSRRLREALKVFGDCFGAKRSRRWRRKLRRLGSRLGPARDADVQARRLAEALASAKRASHRPGIERLALRVGRDRQAARPKVVKAIENLKDSGILDEMRAAAAKAPGDLHAGGRRGAAEMYRRTREEITSRLEALLTQAASLEDPADLDGHHRMRICAKRLRYTLEMCRPAYGRKLDVIISRAKGLQTMLGDLHDCDVWIAQLKRFGRGDLDRMREHRGRARPLAPLRAVIDAMIEAQQDRRGEMFSALRSYWAELAAAHLWEKLRGMLGRRVSIIRP